MEFETACIHAGQTPDPATGAVMTPIYQTSTYVQQGVGKHLGYEYSRTGNPTRSALETCLAELEGANFGLAFASGMAATDAVLRLLAPGDHVLAGNDVYGGTFRLFERVLRTYGLDFSYVDTTDLDQVEAFLRPQTRLVWLETPSNPMLSVTDIRAVTELVRSCSDDFQQGQNSRPSSTLDGSADGSSPRSGRPWLVVDNTFATPYLQRPLELGADLIVHSTTKYLGGHSDVIGGAVMGRDPDLQERLAFLQNAIGAVPGPMDSFLVLRGIKTLPVRMDRHAVNAQAVADFLGQHPQVERVMYPFHASHPQQNIAHQQMRNGGGMVSFILKGGVEAARKAAESTRLFSLAESLGGVESLIEVPAAMTHASTANSPLAVNPGLVRLSVGLENLADLIADLDQAIA